jgi:leucyl-tRNA synthetase
MEFKHQEIDKKWQEYWAKNKTFKAKNNSEKPKYYVLDMFPYPSGAGLHVGHPLGYIASDIFARYKRQQGFNVLHPMGYDAYGLPAEQYAIATGTHPAITTEVNIKRYREQLDSIGFSFDWDREVRTSDPEYYKWTQWTFIQLFKHWYNYDTDKAQSIDTLIHIFERDGNANVHAANNCLKLFGAADWKKMTEKEQQDVLMHYRLAYNGLADVNWCPALGTVLANDEVVDGKSVRGNHPVERKKMRQWFLRISAYAQRLLDGLEKIDWSDSIKEVQKNWIGRSEGAIVHFEVEGQKDKLVVFTTRPDTLWGATFMVLAPEHEMVKSITTSGQKAKIEAYVKMAKNRSERERQADTKTISGEFTGAYGINPVNGEKIPVWIADYVLASYGTGAIMAVPAHDSRDFAFAQYFGLPIKQVVLREGEEASDPNTWDDAYDSKDGIMVNSGFISGKKVKDAISATIDFLVDNKLGFRKVNYRLRDAIFSRQRYWGEPIPVYYKDGTAYPLEEHELPLRLPKIDEYLPTSDGRPPLARAKNWTNEQGYPLDVNTMPGFAGSSAYYYRYMDPHNQERYFSKEAIEYWQDVDLYLGGDEHATGHLIYSRFWAKFLYDIGLGVKDEPYKKLINQGKIQGRSSFVYRVNYEKYAEYLLWEYIKQMGKEKDFVRNYRDGHRKFDFYNKEANLIIEIKSQEKLEKLETPYEEYIKTTDKKLLLLPVADIVKMDEHSMQAIRQAVENSEKGVVFEHHEKIALKPLYISKDVKDRKLFSSPIHVDINIVDNDILDIEAFRNWREEFADAEFILSEDGKYHCGHEIEKMSKSMYNVQNPDDLIARYGADTFRLYEMFLGPIEHHKPWDTKGIEGISRFIKRFWRLFFNDKGEWIVEQQTPTEEEWKVIHQTIKKTKEDIERFSFNTAISQFMIAVNEFTSMKMHKFEILEVFVRLIASFAPHLSEELWHRLGHRDSVTFASFPQYDERYLKEDNIEYPVSFNGKMRFKIQLPAGLMDEKVVEKIVKKHESAQKWLEGKQIVKLIFVREKIINVVVR